MSVRRPLTAVLGAAALALLAGCADPQTGPSEPVAATPPAHPSSGEEEAVLAAYTGMWEAVADASHEGADESADLEEHAVGAALALMTDALRGARAEGAQVTGEPVLDPSVRIEDADRAEVTDCLDDSDWNLGAGASSQGGPRRVDAALIHDGLAWRVSDLRIWETGTC